MHARVRTLVVIALACSSIFVGAPAAFADAERVVDKAADVSVHKPDGEIVYETDKWHDIQNVTLRNDQRNSDRIAVRMKFHRLTSATTLSIRVLIDTNGYGKPEYRFDKTDGQRPGVFVGPWGEKRVCDGAFAANYNTDVVRFSAPRSCFDNPGAVRARGLAFGGWANPTRVSIDMSPWTGEVRRS